MAFQILPVTTNVSALTMAETMFGDGITIISATYTGDPRSAGIYANGTTISPGVVPSDAGVILSTGIASQFTTYAAANTSAGFVSTNTQGVENATEMNGIAGASTHDGAFFDATFVPEGDMLTMRLVFASEEYLEWVNSGFNDAVGIWVNGQKIELALGNGDISIDNINTTSNPNLFVNNASGSLNTAMDGLTVVLTLKAPVMAGYPNTIHVGIADAGDSVYDSSILIVADSVQTALIAVDDTVNVTGYGEKTVWLSANDITTGRNGVQVTHLNNVAVTTNQTVTLTTGDMLRLNADGSVTILSAGVSNPVTFTYTISDDSGTVDTAFVTVIPDAVDGTSGNDQMHVGYTDADGNMIDGSDGASEAIYGYGGNDKITAGEGDDVIDGGDGDDFMRAGAGDDLVKGGAGNDVLDGQSGADTMDGGLGNDVYWLDNAGDVITETNGGGYDKVLSQLSHSLLDGFEELWLIEGSAATTGTGNALANKIVGNANANLLTGGNGADTLFGEDGDDQLFGGDGNDHLHAGSGSDTLDGGAGKDKLYGSTGGDALYGGADADQLTAGSDGDILSGGAGNDLLSGGTGADVFVFAADGSRDTVKNFTLGIDTIDLGELQALSLRVTGATAFLQIDATTSVTFSDIADPSLWSLDTLFA